MNKLVIWISALRLRTLPLAAASIILSAGLAAQAHIFDPVIFTFTLITALLLQILSNLANDYGDAISGADNDFRVGPTRAMQTGVISKKSMKRAILITVVVTICSGVSLLFIALGNDLTSWLLFLALGVLALAAAITYTMGKLPYGYRALGDLSVFIFFGLLGVIGSYYLYAHTFHYGLLLPACSIGMLSAAVLNINNMRDVFNDKAANKITLVVLWGRRKAYIYHLFLLFTCQLLACLYLCTLIDVAAWQYLFLLTLIPFSKSCLRLSVAINGDCRDGDIFNQELKNTAISSFVFALLFALLLIPVS
ncbi:1,4-dihydroxy-2-naphthoate octaprenyltransferase [Psychromonas sp. MME2]|uniref:1,4-dihydroxy-2-naphthoate octaprenyltransferase n=1 Tax=Psychromonas sp. MME2 TaxID=3231033 RepID=UPI00339BC31C